MKYFITLVSLLTVTSIGSAQDNITWADQIGCLVYTHCTPCHNDNGIAPFKLESYSDAYTRRYQMEEAISLKYMPPWPPNASYSRLANERLLSDEEVKIFQLWVQNGSPEGNQAVAPNPPQVISNVKIPEPDFSATLPEFTVPDLTELDLYRCFRIPTNESADRFITGVEILPGNRSIVHHVLLFADTSDIPKKLDDADPGPGYTCFGGIGSNSFSMISGWVPGSDANFSPDGMGLLLPKGADLVLQLHYPEGSAGEKDATTINFKFSEEENLRSILNIPALNHFSSLEDTLYIPANTRRTFHARQIVPFDLTITGIAPHAHLICESMKAFAVTPIGDTIRLIDVPHWDFEWQGFYDYQVAKKIPFGSELHGVVTYNNTTSNPHLPHEVPVDVWVGEATTDEMLLFFMSLSFYQPGDENMIIDTTGHLPHLDGCSTFADVMTSSTDVSDQVSVLIGPNPTQGEVFVQMTKVKMINQREFILSDIYGRSLFRAPVNNTSTNIQLPSNLTDGIYLYTIEDQDHKKLIPYRKLTLIRG